MKAPWSYALCALLMVGVGLLIAISSPPKQEPDEERAFAAAVEDYFSDLLKYVPIEENGVVYASISICLEAPSRIDFEKLNRAFTDAKVVSYPISQCSAEAKTADPFLIGREQHYDPNGIEAADVIIRGFCVGTDACEVTVEEWFRVDRFKVVRIGPAWQVRSRENILLRD